MDGINSKKTKLDIIKDLIEKNISSLVARKQRAINNFNSLHSPKQGEENTNYSIQKQIYTNSYLTELTKCNNSIKEYELYFQRCSMYVYYLNAREENSLKEVEYRYALLDLIQKESMNKFQNEYALNSRLIDIDDDVLKLVNQYSLKNLEVPTDILKKLMNSEEKLEKIKEINNSVNKEMEYKKLFIEEPFNITDSVIENDLLFNYEIETVVDSLYNKKEIKNEVHTK